MDRINSGTDRKTGMAALARLLMGLSLWNQIQRPDAS
jgi:hypothetical protein